MGLPIMTLMCLRCIYKIIDRKRGITCYEEPCKFQEA